MEDKEQNSVYGIQDTESEKCKGKDCCDASHTWNDELKKCESFQVMGPRNQIENYNENEVYTKYA